MGKSRGLLLILLAVEWLALVLAVKWLALVLLAVEWLAVLVWAVLHLLAVHLWGALGTLGHLLAIGLRAWLLMRMALLPCGRLPGVWLHMRMALLCGCLPAVWLFMLLPLLRGCLPAI